MNSNMKKEKARRVTSAKKELSALGIPGAKVTATIHGGPSIASFDIAIKSGQALLLMPEIDGETAKITALVKVITGLLDARRAATTGAGLAADGGSPFRPELAAALRHKVHADSGGFVVLAHVAGNVLGRLELHKNWSELFLPTAKYHDGSPAVHGLSGAAREGGGGLLALISSRAQLELFYAAGGEEADVLVVHVESLILALSGLHDERVSVVGPRGGAARGGTAASLCVWSAETGEPLEVAQRFLHKDPKTRAYVAWLQLLRKGDKEKGKDGVCLIVLAMAVAYGLVCAHPNSAGCNKNVRFNTRGSLTVMGVDNMAGLKGADVHRATKAAWGCKDVQNWLWFLRAMKNEARGGGGAWYPMLVFQGELGVPGSARAIPSADYFHLPVGEGLGFSSFLRCVGLSSGFSTNAKAKFNAAREETMAALAEGKAPEWRYLFAGIKHSQTAAAVEKGGAFPVAASLHPNPFRLQIIALPRSQASEALAPARK
jgi:hypothetical protein